MQRKVYDSKFKATVVLKALSGEMTAAELAKRYSIHPLVITKWKKHAVDLLPSLFTRNPEREQEDREKRESALFQQIGQLQYELDWLKKKTGAYSR